jgi:LPXTG-motif cell wall-anchored protein
MEPLVSWAWTWPLALGLQAVLGVTIWVLSRRRRADTPPAQTPWIATRAERDWDHERLAR